MSEKPKALIVDDEEDLCLLMQMTLHKMNIETEVAYNLKEAVHHLQNNRFNFCLTDLNLPDGSGMSLVEHINKNFPDIPVAVITAHGSVDLAIEALKIGAFDFVNKPLELPRLRQLIGNALKVKPIEETVAEPKIKEDPSTQKLLGNSLVMQNLRKTIKKLARSQAPVFLQGESGTGKEVVASLIHELSPREDGKFVPVNCGAIPSELMESEFFGHKKGSFTGATTDKQGLFQLADKGTLFLDEVADLPLNMQVKLLRAIQEKKIRPIGGNKEIPVDIRLLSATHKNLAALVNEGKFRQDLFYRINVIELNLPSLNERGDDILLLADYFLQKISEDWQTESVPNLSLAAKQALRQHTFKGNVRELRNILERAITMCDGDEILESHLNLTKVAQAPVFNNNIVESVSFVNDNQNDVQVLPVLTQGFMDEKGHVLEEETLNPTLQNLPQTKISQPLEQQLQSQLHNQIHNDSQRFNEVRHNNQSDVQQALNIQNQHLNGSQQHSNPTLAQQVFLHQSNSQMNTINNLSFDDISHNSLNTVPNLESHMHVFMTLDKLPEGGLEAYLESEEKRLMCDALQQCKGNKTKAAELLGMSFRSFRYKVKKLNVLDD